jgi:hypothetical protein
MFIATALLYPCALTVLCLGAGLLVDRVSGSYLPAQLLVSVGAAALIALSQLSTLIPKFAPATPYAMAALAALGLGLASARLGAFARRVRSWPVHAGAPMLVYALALAPVLLVGRASFSSFMALADSAVHIMGADYLIHHGQSYAHLDLRNSYGQFIHQYYGSSYPSGADTLFGGSARLLGLSLLWAFQPFNAFMLATAYGPAWLLARRMRLSGAWAVIAAITVVLPALVYAYELLGSVKEITALSMLLTSGCLVVLHDRWLGRRAAGALPLALVLAGGLSALGVAFGVWALGATAVLAVALAAELRARRMRPRRVVVQIGVAALAGLLAALPTWTSLSGSLRVASAIASSGGSGNLHSPLRAIQVFGIWLGGSYKLAPVGSSLQLTHVLIAIALAAALLGAVQVLRTRAFALAGWLALSLLAWLVVTESVSTWASAKTLMLSSPVVVLLAWGGVAALRTLPGRALTLGAAGLLALALAGGVLASDVLQYRSSNLAPTARYQELASLNSRFAGRGPTLFTDFDEYSLYLLRDLDVGGPDFVYPPPALAAAAGGYGNPVDLNRVGPSALLAYPLIVTRRDPQAPRPPSAYRLAWQGSYYEVWRREAGAPAALDHLALAGTPATQCRQIGREVQVTAAQKPQAGGGRVVVAPAPTIVSIALARSPHPARWGHQRGGLVMSSAGSLRARFGLPAAGVWQVWVKGQIMPAVALSIDGRALASIAGQLSGNSLVPDVVPPLTVRLGAGMHSLTVTRPGATLAPGDGGSAVLDGVVLTPGATDPAAVREVAMSSWRSLCGGRYDWVELVPGT